MAFPGRPVAVTVVSFHVSRIKKQGIIFMDNNDMEKTSPLLNTFFVKRVVGTLIVMLFIVGGLSSYFTLIKEDKPDLEIPFAQIKTEWAGADPESIEKRVDNLHITSADKPSSEVDKTVDKLIKKNKRK